jgi:hypothetical protein
MKEELMFATSRGQSRVPKELVRPIIQMQKNKIKNRRSNAYKQLG